MSNLIARKDLTRNNTVEYGFEIQNNLHADILNWTQEVVMAGWSGVAVTIG